MHCTSTLNREIERRTDNTEEIVKILNGLSTKNEIYYTIYSHIYYNSLSYISYKYTTTIITACA